MNDAKKLVQDFYTIGSVQHDIAKASQMLDSGYVLHDPFLRGPVKGPSEWTRVESMYLKALPGFQLKIEEQFGEGDLVTTCWSVEGTNEGEFMGFPATHKKVSITGTSVTRVSNGKIAEEWITWDAMGMFEQLGIVKFPKFQQAA